MNNASHQERQIELNRVMLQVLSSWKGLNCDPLGTAYGVSRRSSVQKPAASVSIMIVSACSEMGGKRSACIERVA